MNGVQSDVAVLARADGRGMSRQSFFWDEKEVPMIDRGWWDHLVPKVMSSLRGQVQELIRSESARVVGKDWFATARNPNGLVRLKNGQTIPVFHVVFLGNSKAFVIPAPKREAEHRTVHTETEFASGTPLGEDELAIAPELRVEVVNRSSLYRGGVVRSNVTARLAPPA
jgi:hypothetical protein